MDDDRRLSERLLIEALGSEGKIRILKALAEKQNHLFSTYALIKATGLRRQDARRILAQLCQIGLVKSITYGVKKYQINTENEIVKQLIIFLRNIGTI